MIVMKFGGSSLKDAAAVDRVAAIVRDRLDRRPLVVVSAIGDTTDALVDLLAELDAGRAERARGIAVAIGRHHEQVIEAVLDDAALADEARAELAAGLARLGRLIDGMECLGEVSARSRDAVLVSGELISAPLIALFFASRGLPAEAVDATALIRTDASHGCAAPDAAVTDERCRAELPPLLDAGRLPVLAGYVGATADGVPTTLGRGGSDLTASLVARALGAAALEYWKDVDGILTADPGLVPGARPVAQLSFREAAELAFLGARVLHPASIQPAVEAGIPVRVRSSYHPERPGTLIAKRQDLPAPSSPAGVISSVAAKRDQLLVNVYSTRMLGATGFLRRVFEVFDRLGLSVDHIATSEVNVTVTLGATDLVERLEAELGAVAQVDLERDVGVLSVVGERLHDTPGVAARIFGALADVNVKLVTYGGSGVNLSLVVRDEQVPAALQRLHAELCCRDDGEVPGA